MFRAAFQSENNGTNITASITPVKDNFLDFFNIYFCPRKEDTENPEESRKCKKIIIYGRTKSKWRLE